MFSYQTFLKEKNDLPFEKCQEYHQNILNAVKKGDSEFVQSVAFFGDKRLLSQTLNRKHYIKDCKLRLKMV